MSGKLIDVRRSDHCDRCRRLAKLRAVLVQEAAEIQWRCEACIDANVDAEAYDLICEKVGIKYLC